MAEKYSGGYILFCTERQVGAVIVSNVCQPSLLCMCVTLVVRPWSCTTNRAALLCIFSRVSILFWVCGFQAIAPYSNFGLTSMLYSASFTFGLTGYRVRLSRPGVLADLDAELGICLVQDSFASIVTPRYG